MALLSGPWQQLINWYSQQIDYPNIVKETGGASVLSIENILKTLLLKTVPRFMYDFFDDQEIKLFVVEAHAGEWLYTIGGQSIDFQAEVATFPNRSRAEEEGFYHAFLELEKRSSSIKPSGSE